MNQSLKKTTTDFKIVDFKEDYATAFAELNYEWLNAHFSIEVHDREMLDHPYEYIILKGGQIFFLKDIDEHILETAALIVEDEHTLELAKMAITPDHRGQGLGKLLLNHAIAAARKTDKKKLVLESSTKLTNAIALYQKVGFEKVAQTGCSPYSRCDIRMQMNLP